ncbi:MAG: hypothetical protein GX957_00490 [Clostridiaceae bacterium]|nr:hypothetical protein [Clostridiaceae bacterium]
MQHSKHLPLQINIEAEKGVLMFDKIIAIFDLSGIIIVDTKLMFWY